MIHPTPKPHKPQVATTWTGWPIATPTASLPGRTAPCDADVPGTEFVGHVWTTLTPTPKTWASRTARKTTFAVHRLGSTWSPVSYFGICIGVPTPRSASAGH